MEHIEELKKAEVENKCKDFFDTLQVSGETAEQALYLCGVIYNDTKIFMNIVNTSKLSNEAKIVNQLARYLNNGYKVANLQCQTSHGNLIML